MKNKLFYLFIFSFLFTGLFILNQTYILDDFQPRTLRLSFNFKTGDDDVFQLFYRERDGKFQEKFSESIQILGKDENIPDSLNVSHFRFDFGNRFNESSVIINEVVLSYNGNQKIIERDSIGRYFIPNNFVLPSINGYGRKVIGERSDPFFTSTDLTSSIQSLKERPNYYRVFLNFVLTMVFSLSLVFAFHYSFPSAYYVRNVHLGFSILFVFCLCFVHLDEFFGLDNTKISEKRDLLQKPTMTFDGINEYPSNFEAYYNENFGFRKKLVSLGATFKAKIFNSSTKSDKVIIGHENWLFYWEDVIRSSYLNLNPFADDKLGDFGKSMVEINTYAKKNDIGFLVTIYPNKHTIYEDMIPNRYRRLKNPGEKRIDQFYSFLNHEGILNVDNRDVLFSMKQKSTLYLKNDSHWNSYGAYYSYKNVVKVLSNSNDKISLPLSLSDFNIQINENYKEGDLLNLLGVDNSQGFFKDVYFSFSPKELDSYRRNEGVYGSKSLVIENLKSTSNEVALFFGDSYSYEILQFMPHHFKKIIYIRNIRMSRELIEKINPNIIVYGIVERNLEYF